MLFGIIIACNNYRPKPKEILKWKKTQMDTTKDALS